MSSEIFLTNPTNRPAVPALTCDEPWFDSIHITLPPGEDGRALVNYTPWNREEQQFDSGQSSKFEITSLVPRLTTDPEFLILWDTMVAYIKKEMIAQGIALPD